MCFHSLNKSISLLYCILSDYKQYVKKLDGCDSSTQWCMVSLSIVEACLSCQRLLKASCWIDLSFAMEFDCLTIWISKWASCCESAFISVWAICISHSSCKRWLCWKKMWTFYTRCERLSWLSWRLQELYVENFF